MTIWDEFVAKIENKRWRLWIDMNVLRLSTMKNVYRYFWGVCCLCYFPIDLTIIINIYFIFSSDHYMSTYLAWELVPKAKVNPVVIVIPEQPAWTSRRTPRHMMSSLSSALGLVVARKVGVKRQPRRHFKSLWPQTKFQSAGQPTYIILRVLNSHSPNQATNTKSWQILKLNGWISGDLGKPWLFKQ